MRVKHLDVRQLHKVAARCYDRYWYVVNSPDRFQPGTKTRLTTSRLWLTYRELILLLYHKSR